MNSDPESKPALRTLLRARRRALGTDFRDAAARAAAVHARHLPGWDSARRVALFWANDGELDPVNLLADCRRRHCEVYLPVLADGNHLEFRLWSREETLAPNVLGIPEPGSDSPQCAPAQLDIVVMPLVAWQRDGTRLGMGGGFYDRTFAGVSGPLRVGLAFACQEASALPGDPWDIPLDFVITEAGLTRCNGPGKTSREI
ncbi:5-formyltetrahydrofolate cyclo-ligase [Kineobactrum sediminis]|uniref:5-formyltetrahydrofolate cyclo-ligase n=1 Tax=Kineobactrum sediminis TaxID=1905677 RepID=A0A2N5Y565_9GAMM|nr:5-formyltetrahydrofolate cyclo-ligase [Kineobactrum sediminis]PLW83544.1 5-formyltetrahydrofolate cyclo-ligase [Kineobactrum sediminis]